MIDALLNGEREDATVAEWRARMFERLGFEPADVGLLVAAGADWHRAEAMLAAGCDRATCLWILC